MREQSQPGDDLLEQMRVGSTPFEYQPDRGFVLDEKRCGEVVVILDAGAHISAREALEHDERRDRAAEVDCRDDVGQRHVMAAEQGELLALQSCQRAADGLARVDAHPNRDRVDEHADHLVDAGHRGIPSRDDRCENDVVAVVAVSEDKRPRELDDGVECRRRLRRHVTQRGGYVDAQACA